MIMTGKTTAQLEEAHLQEEKTRKLSEIDAGLASALNDGFEFMGHMWQADPMAQSLALGTIVLSQSDPSVFPREWRNKDNEMITFQSIAEFGPFTRAMKNFVDATYSAVFSKKTAIRVATTMSELEAL